MLKDIRRKIGTKGEGNALFEKATILIEFERVFLGSDPAYRVAEVFEDRVLIEFRFLLIRHNISPDLIMS